MTSPTDWPPAIAPHLAVMERVRAGLKDPAIRKMADALHEVTASGRRARAQVQPKGEGGRWVSPDPLVKLRESYLSALQRSIVEHYDARIAEHNAELTKLRAFAALAASTCGMNNCNCPTAPKIRQALNELLENSPK